MKPFREWSFRRVLFLGVGWVVLCVLGVVLRLYLQMRSEMSGSAGIGAVSVGFVDVWLLVPIGPPVVLFLIWLIARLRR